MSSSISENLSNETEKRGVVYVDETDLNTAAAISTLVICVSGLLGNLMVLFVIIVLREYKKSNAYWYMLQLAIADTLFLLTLPFTVSETFNKAWIYPEWLCKAKETILFINYYASMWFLTIMSIDRYVAVCHTFSVRLQKLRKLRVSLVVALVVWTLCVAMSTPMMLYTFKTGFLPHCRCTLVFPGENQIGLSDEDYEEIKKLGWHHGGEAQCREIDPAFYESVVNSSLTANSSIEYDYSDYSEYYGESGNYSFESEDEAESDGIQLCHNKGRSGGWAALIVFNFSVMFVLPLMVMVVCYFLVVKRLKNVQVRKAPTNQPFVTENNNCDGNSKSGTGRIGRDRRKITIMCGTLVGCFVMCWLPFHVIHVTKIVAAIPGSPQYCATLAVIGSELAYLNSALNPWLYNFLRGDFSRRLKLAFGRVLTITDSSNSCPSVRFERAAMPDNCSSNNVVTIVTKVFKNTSKKPSHICETENIPLDLTNYGISKSPSFTATNSSEDNNPGEKLLGN